MATFAVTAVAFPLGAQAAAGGHAAAARTDGLCELLDLVLRLVCSQGAPPQGAPPAGGTSGAAQPDRIRRTSTDVEYDPRRLTVTFKRGTPRRTVDAVLARADVTLEQAVPRIDAYLVGVDPARRSAALESLRASADVASADQEVIVHALDMTPNDAEWPEQWGLRVTGISQAWQLAPSAQDVVVAVIDTGVDATHPDLQGAVVAGYDFINQTATPNDDEGHGTGVAGVIAARKDNRIGIAGICGGCRIMPVKVLDHNGVGDDSAIAAGIVWATDHGAKVINLSLGGPGTTPALSDGIAYAVGKGVLVVAAAGNSAASVPFYPAADPRVVSVAATTQGDRPYVWSNFGEWVKLAAPGCNPAPMLEGGYGSFCGTSSATPLVTGLAALAVAANPRATAEEIEQALERPAVAMAGFVRYGRIDAPRTLSLLAPAVRAERAATTALIKGSLTPTAPSRTYVRATVGGRVTATLTFRSAGRLSLSLTPQQPPGPTTRVTGGGQLRLMRTLHAGTVRFVVRGRRARFELAIVTTPERSTTSGRSDR